MTHERQTEDPSAKSDVDPYRAQRELERWLFNGENAEDAARRLGRRSLRLAHNPNAEVAFYIVYGPDGDIKYLQPGEPGTPEARTE